VARGKGRAGVAHHSAKTRLNRARKSTAGVQVAAGVPSIAIDTSAPPEAQEQFATVHGPAVLPAGLARLANPPNTVPGDVLAQQLAACLDQLARRGIVVRG